MICPNTKCPASNDLILLCGIDCGDTVLVPCFSLLLQTSPVSSLFLNLLKTTGFEKCVDGVESKSLPKGIMCALTDVL